MLAVGAPSEACTDVPRLSSLSSVKRLIWIKAGLTHNDLYYRKDPEKITWEETKSKQVQGQLYDLSIDADGESLRPIGGHLREP